MSSPSYLAEEPPLKPVTRRRFLQTALLAAGGMVWPVRTSPGKAAARPASARRAKADGFPFDLPGAPFAATRATGRSNPIVEENRRPGNAGWLPRRYQFDIHGYASASSLAAGETIEFFVDTDAARFDLEVYRLGYYGGAGGRQLLAAAALPGTAQPPSRLEARTGLSTCSHWSVSYRLTAPGDWVSGVYLTKLTRRDTGGEGFILFVLRDDARPADLLCQQSVATFHAYNDYGGKSLYSHISNDCATISGAERAVAVSLNRPYMAPLEDQSQFLRIEYPLIYWLEAQGYDAAYCTDLDTHRWGKPGERNRLLNHRACLSIGHDEYWSQERRAAVTAARDAGVHLGFFSANTCYWRVRFEPDPLTGQPDRVMICYKNTEGGPADPSGHPTTTWRDPSGVNDPENSLLGVQYLGDNDLGYFPLRVSAEQAADRAFRHTGLAALPPGAFAEIGRQLVGWEWDAVTDNGLTPPGLTILAESPVFGAVLTDAGDSARRVARAAAAHTTRYIAPSGAQVFASGAAQWSWGLALVEPDARLQQITGNLLADMGVLPATPADSLILDEAPAAAPPVAAVAAGRPVRAVVSAVATDAAATVRWETDREALAQLWLGHAREFVNEVQHAPLGPQRSGEWTIGGLQPDTVYYYRLAAWEAPDRVAFSEVQEFRTAPGGAAFGARRWLEAAAAPAACAVRPAARPLLHWARRNEALAAGLGVVATLAAGLSIWRWSARWRAARRAGLNSSPD